MQGLEDSSFTGRDAIMTSLPVKERADFQRAHDTLLTHARLMQSLQRQRQARVIIRTWRSIHIVLATIAVLVILYHGLMELFTSVLHV
jgi:hypothetical protein